MSEKSGAYGVPERRAPRLLERVHEAARRRYFSTRTEEAYVHWIKRFIYFSGRRHPAELGEAEVTAFLNHLAAVLTRAEVQRLLGAMQGTKWLMASLLYGSGLRVMECLRLRVKDVDLDYHCAIRSRRIFSRLAMTSARCRSSSVTLTCRRR